MGSETLDTMTVIHTRWVAVRVAGRAPIFAFTLYLSCTSFAISEGMLSRYYGDFS